MVLGVVMITRGVSAQNAISSIYFPYPPDVIPADLAAEKTKRVNREVSRIEAEALTQLHALPINSGTAMRQVQILGKLELFDGNLLLTIFAAKNAGFVPRRTQRRMTNGGRPGIQIRCGHRVRRPSYPPRTTNRERGNL